MSSSDSGSLVINENASSADRPVLRSVFDPNPVVGESKPLAITPGSTPATITDETLTTISDTDAVLPAETQDIVQKVLLMVGIGNLFVAAAGIAVLSALGYTIAGGILIGATCFLAIATLIVYSLFRYARRQSAKKKFLDEFSLSKAFEVIRSLLFATIIALILAVASAIQGAVLLGHINSAPPYIPFVDPFIYQRTITYMFIWLGSGSIALGLFGIIVESLLLYRLFVVFRDLRSMAPGDGFLSINRSPPVRSSISEVNNGKMMIAPNGTYSTYVRYIDVPAEGSPEMVRHGSATDV